MDATAWKETQSESLRAWRRTPFASLERLLVAAAIAAASIMGLGVATAIVRGTHLISHEVATAIGSVLIPLGGGLVAGTLALSAVALVMVWRRAR
ncbi:MAG: hypothetical protein GC150_01050 [Rhizobiales bacterium]|nr:hypothetical protein [Hyphomicrobiales bacterium]